MIKNHDTRYLSRQLIRQTFFHLIYETFNLKPDSIVNLQ